MELELSLRSVIGLLLLGALAVAGCDKQSQPSQQANVTAPANASAPAPGGTVDRSHHGEAAPTIAFTDSAGKKTTLAAFKGKPVLLNLWATWCVPCIKEMPTLDTLAGKVGDTLVVLPLSQDLKGMEVVGPFFERRGYKHLKPYLDTDTAFSVQMGTNLPTTILYDSAGKEVWRVSGDFDWAGDAAAKLIAEAK
ncbi:TlpA family protein disulfide reductase [Sphingomonas sp. R1]|uniref:TlpA family protein disulfide reductase n=1 Tax=Sphingomonas sp. R1 TaxID=399176 RepID=UPI0022243470|nr:TlpA disulfide reductase family protein [Sphingomonas sp. R1]UYY76370.1 TlpA family protein disulfide reductase [Sphingomonas sp. R1]